MAEQSSPLDDRPLGEAFPKVDTSKPIEAWDPATGKATPLDTSGRVEVPE